MKKSLIWAFLLKCSIGLAQMPNDAIMMPQKSICVGLTAQQSTFKEYWEGSLLRNNFNIGTNTNQSLALMASIGITNRINIILNAPYVKTSNSAGTLAGQRGFQDASAWLKISPLNPSSKLSVVLLGGASIPMTNYIAELQPMSIGNQSKMLNGRLVLRYLTSMGIYVGGLGTYTTRNNVEIDKNAYWVNERLVTGNMVSLPDSYDYGARIGMLKPKWQFEIFADKSTSLSGDNIRYNDMPSITNKVNFTQAGAYFKFQPKKIGFNVRASQTLEGLNTGKMLNISLGLLFQTGGRRSNRFEY